ncbi:ribose 5-phosphate isomerase B [Gallibacterium anatis]|uniref:Ribose 5-phosphate isomerase n=1 Tax=Gallibacterium anatis TaxID=750 RepID=A0A0A2XEG6_9PAST|nr:ribose 5-phosphate isomerase B [Gallibacterium anatis]KGQ24125.1 ribose 5-phosphate isomerase [Gallibacterium anatis]KGQ29417.1 ribose 5-phosphate isomerase [Gallibacterium anatis]KGQ30821.1 ribose 5-phosphate isomerase [Gallibacterium anatis]KGQ48130.1 ribose 5-phosphate isomerase [Gallibacterium anatis 10672-6]KGQ50010.1 ribose 5-phosphate isomerase [Gallibacterium anatis]
MKIAIGCDEAAYNLKVELMKYLDSLGIEYDDFGSKAGDVVLYPDVAEAVALAVAQGKYERAILTCGTGIGMSITANKIPGVRAAVCHDVFSAERARKSNNAQIICFGERVIGVELAKALLKTWLNCDFAGGGSAPKVAKINEIDQKYHRC